MAIKRDSSLLDDSTSKTGGTTIPTSLVKKEVQEFTGQDTTKFIQTDEIIDGGTPPKVSVVGRTYPDIITEYINSPKIVMTLLTIISILIFHEKISTKEDLVLPLIVSAILNFIWFSPSIFSKTWNQIKRLWNLLK